MQDIGYNDRFAALKAAIRGSVAPDPVPPDDPIDPIPDPPSDDNYRDAVEDFIDGIANDPTREVQLPWKDKVLRLAPKVSGGRHMKWEGLTDKVIDLNGCTFLGTEPSLMLRLDRLDGVTIKNGRFMGHGDLAAEAMWDASNRQFVVSNGSPTGRNVYTIGTMPAQHTSGSLRNDQVYREVFVQDMSNHRGDASRFGTYELVGRNWVLRSGEAPDFEDGQLVSIQLENNDGHAIVPNNEEHIRNVTFEDLVFCNIPGMAITGETDGNTKFRNIRFHRKQGALLSVASDGLHLDNSRDGVLIEGCDLAYINDDFVNCNAKWARVTNVDGNTVTVSRAVKGHINIGKFCDAGEGIVFCDSGGNFGDRPIDGGSVVVHDSATRSAESGKSHAFAVDSAAGVSVGMLVVNRDRTTSDVTIRNNVFNTTRATGIKARSSNTRIFNNKVLNCYGTAIRVDHFTDRGEGVFPHDVVIEDNEVTGSGRRDDIAEVGGQPQPYFFSDEVEGVAVR